MSLTDPSGGIAAADLADLRRAVGLLNSRSFAIGLSRRIGGVVSLSALAPGTLRAAVLQASEAALKAAMAWAVKSAERRPGAGERVHALALGLSGAVGGGLGLPGVLAELPVSTTVLMRAIAAIAREEGEDLAAPQAPVVCLEVFALEGGGAGAALDTGYFAIRAALAQAVGEASAYLARRNVAEAGAPALVRLLSAVASRFGVTVGEKVAAQAIPILGAGMGAAVNLAFGRHYQSLARGHFIVRRLERRYGAALVRQAAVGIV
jgi:hypothetical protein